MEARPEAEDGFLEHGLCNGSIDHHKSPYLTRLSYGWTLAPYIMAMSGLLGLQTVMQRRTNGRVGI